MPFSLAAKSDFVTIPKRFPFFVHDGKRPNVLFEHDFGGLLQRAFPAGGEHREDHEIPDSHRVSPFGCKLRETSSAYWRRDWRLSAPTKLYPQKSLYNAARNLYYPAGVFPWPGKPPRNSLLPVLNH